MTPTKPTPELPDDTQGKKFAASHIGAAAHLVADGSGGAITADPKPENHCIDCCCAHSWKALGIDTYTGKSIAEHITELKERADRHPDRQLVERIRELEDALWLGWNEMNGIRAQDGVPHDKYGMRYGVSEKWFSEMVEKMGDALRELKQPWPPKVSRNAGARATGEGE